MNTEKLKLECAETEIKSIGLWRRYINITITILDIIHRLVFYWKLKASNTRFCVCVFFFYTTESKDWNNLEISTAKYVTRLKIFFVFCIYLRKTFSSIYPFILFWWNKMIGSSLNILAWEWDVSVSQIWRLCTCLQVSQYNTWLTAYLVSSSGGKTFLNCSISGKRNTPCWAPPWRRLAAHAQHALSHVRNARTEIRNRKLTMSSYSSLNKILKRYLRIANKYFALKLNKLRMFFRLHNVTIVGFCYLLFTYLLHVSVVRPSSGRNMYLLEITLLTTDPLFLEY
jgi:hypothetical protein